VDKEGNASKPLCSEVYNRNMGFAGTSHMMASSYSISHGTWTLKLLFHLFCLTILNAFVICSSFGGTLTYSVSRTICRRAYLDCTEYHSKSFGVKSWPANITWSSHHKVLLSAIFLLKRFQNAKSGPKFGWRGVVVVIPLPGKKGSATLPACVLLRKHLWNGTPMRAVTKIPLVLFKTFILASHVMPKNVIFILIKADSQY
jgi:hypothetical protein